MFDTITKATFGHLDMAWDERRAALAEEAIAPILDVVSAAVCENRTLAASEAPGLTVVTMGEDNPVRRAVKVAAVGMPVIEEPDQVMVLKDILA